MSEMDIRNIPESERMNGSFMKPQIEHKDENLDERQKRSMTSLVGIPTKIDETANLGVEVGSSQVEYIESENLNDVDDVEICLKVVLFYLHVYYHDDIHVNI